MIVPLALKILGSVSAAALAGTGTLIAIPLLNPPPPDAWLDAPAAGSIVTAGDILLSMHTNVDDVTYVRAVISQDGEPDVELTDTTPDTTSRGANALPLTWGVVAWTAAVGEYDVLVQTCSPGACWADGGSAHITVVDQGPPFAEMPDTEATDPDPIPTDEPGDDPSDGPGDDPGDPGTDDPDPGTDDPGTDPVDEVPSGEVFQEFRDGAKTATTFTVRGVTPASTEVTVLVQVVPQGQGYDQQRWQALSCTPVGGACTTSQFDAGTNGGVARTGYYQLVLQNGSAIVYDDVHSWTLVR